MRRLLLGTVLVAGLALSACGGGGGTTVTVASPSSAGTGASTSPGTSASGDGGAGCTGLTQEEMGRYVLYVQVFPQVRSQSVVDSIRTGLLTDYTPEKFAATLAKLQFLRGNGVPGLGDPGAALDYYAGVNDALAALLAQSDPVPQSAIDAYQAVVGPVAQSIGKQLPINAALSELCKNL